MRPNPILVLVGIVLLAVVGVVAVAGDLTTLAMICCGLCAIGALAVMTELA